MQKIIYRHKGKFEFEAGGSIDELQLAYHTSPYPYRKGMKVVWICHALTADSDVQDWWPGLVGPGKFFDPDRYFIVCANMIGSCYGSSGPSSIDPSTGKPYYLTFPRVTVRDIVNGLDLVRRHIGIEKIDLLIGASIGGFQALEWSIMYPDVIENAVYMATLERVRPWLTAFLESQRMALDADPTFRACGSLEGGKMGMECARTIALISYRCEEGYDLKQWEESEDTMFPERACSYQRYQGRKFSSRFDAYSYYYLSYSVDSENVGRGRGGVPAALAGIRARTMVVSIDTDLIFPPCEIEKMAALIPGAEYHMIKSHFGHDGFLLEYDQIEKILGPFVESI